MKRLIWLAVDSNGDEKITNNPEGWQRFYPKIYVCKPKFIDCLFCKENTNPKEPFCRSKKKCTVPYAVVEETHKIVTWIDETD